MTTHDAQTLAPLTILEDIPHGDGQRRAVLGHDGEIEVATVDYVPGGKSEAYLRALLAAPELLAFVARVEALARTLATGTVLPRSVDFGRLARDAETVLSRGRGR